MDKIFNIILLLSIPFLMMGVIKRVKSFWGGRMGPSVLQPWFDIMKLLRKGEIISSTTTFIFRIAPTISLAAIFAAAMVVPLINHQAIINFEGDFIVFAYLLALSRFFTVIGALDTGSSFEGMGSSREVLFAAFVEPGFFVIISSLAYFTGYKSFSSIMIALHSAGPSTMIVILAVTGLFIMMLAEGCRIPVDDPATHLELTMVHEVMVLDNSGPDLAFILYGSMLKMFIIGALIAGIILPANLSILMTGSLFLLIILCEAVFIGMIESLFARLRLSHVPQFLFVMTALGITLFFIIIMTLEKLL